MSYALGIRPTCEKGFPMSLLLLILLILLCLGGLPQVSGHWHAYGYGPSGLGGILLILLIILLLTGRL